MGPQQVLRAAAALALVATSAIAAPAPAKAPPSREPIAVIDLGPNPADPAARQQIGGALVAAGLTPALADGLGDAFAGIDTPADQPLLEQALAGAQAAYGALDCAAATKAARGALSILAARQVAGVPVPALPKALAYVLLCADRTGDAAAATRTAHELRALGAAEPADLLAKYPDIDALLGAPAIAIDVDTQVPGAPIFIDFEPAGTAPLHLALAPGDHVIAAASGTRRGSLVGTPVASQPKLVVPMPDQAGRWSDVAARIAGWRGQMPSADEISAVLIETHVRAAVIRHGDAIEIWGHAGLGERVAPLEAPRMIGQAGDAAAELADRVASWSAHAPPSDRPLLVEDRGQTAKPAHARWWVYVAVGAALAAAITAVAVRHYESDTQTVELHYP